MQVGQVVNYNNGDGIVRAQIMRIVDEAAAKVFLWAPERGSGFVKLHKGDGAGITRRSPADYGPEGGGVTWHYVEDEVEEASG